MPLKKTTPLVAKAIKHKIKNCSIAGKILGTGTPGKYVSEAGAFLGSINCKGGVVEHAKKTTKKKTKKAYSHYDFSFLENKLKDKQIEPQNLFSEIYSEISKKYPELPINGIKLSILCHLTHNNMEHLLFVNEQLIGKINIKI